MAKLLLGILLFFFGQTLIWYQTNGQFVWKWAKDHPFAMACIFAVPISYAFIIATTYVVGYFNGSLWPGRFIGFATGISSFAVLTSVYMISLLLASILVGIQIIWK